MKNKLTLKQQAFIDYYLGEARGNATKAAMLAGYKESSAYSTGEENLKKPVIKQVIEKAREKLAKKAEITQESVLKELIEDREFARKCKSPSAAVKATELKGKHLGMFSEKHEHTLSGSVTVIIEK